MDFYDWHLLLNIVLSTCIHAVMYQYHIRFYGWWYSIIFLCQDLFPSADGHLGFLFLSVMNNVAINIHVEVFCGHIFSFLGYTCRSGILGSYSNSMFNILRNWQNFFQSSCAILHSTPAMHKSWNFHIFNNTCCCFFFSNYSHSSNFDLLLLPARGFDLHFPNDQQCQSLIL